VEISLTWRCAIWVCATLWFGTTLNGAVAEPKRVLLLNSFGRDFSPWSEYSRDIRAELVRQFREPVDIFDASLATARFSDIKQEEGPFVDYLRALFSEHPLDLTVTVGAPAPPSSSGIGNNFSGHAYAADRDRRAASCAACPFGK
jgi:hypothetical protein